MRCVGLTIGLTCALACGGGAGEPDAVGPDVVLISIDSLRPDHLGAYGYPRETSPVLDALASEGVLFRDAVSTSSWTLPAHAALFTGLFDSAHGLLRDEGRLAPAHRTLAELLADAGYRTGGFYGGPYLDPTFGLDQGFEEWVSCMTRLPEAMEPQEARREARGGVDRAHADVTGPRTVQSVRAWLAESDERPFFLFVHLWDVHYDYIPPPGYAERFDPDYRGDLDARRFARNPAIRADMPARDLEHLIALYDGEILFTDEIVGRILAAVAESGRLEDALVVVTADHGDEFFEHGGKGHRRTLFEEVVRIPLVIRLPGREAAGRVVDEPVRLVDVLPTVLAAAGVGAPAHVQGRDLGPLLRGESLAPASSLLELHLARRSLYALRTGGSKLVSFDGRRYALFDLGSDGRERHPLPADAPGFGPALAELRDRLESSRALARRLGTAGEKAGRIEGDLRRRLEELGYVDPGEDPSR